MTTKIYMRQYVELSVWTAALLVLFFMNPSKDSTSFCIFKLFGFKSCFGCGIGHAIHHALHFNFKQSIQEHIMGIPATLGLLYQIVQSLYYLINTNKNGSTTNVHDAARLTAQ